jgi:hypothetical protein|tara:strand:- start:2200 stop:2385 length:186 start_codon:yes stop_codon:yes gene_type:complete
MKVHAETQIKIEFAKGIEITPIIVFEGIEIESKSFSNKTNQIEELLDYIAYNENGGCDVFI